MVRTTMWFLAIWIAAQSGADGDLLVNPHRAGSGLRTYDGEGQEAGGTALEIAQRVTELAQWCRSHGLSDECDELAREALGAAPGFKPAVALRSGSPRWGVPSEPDRTELRKKKAELGSALATLYSKLAEEKKGASLQYARDECLLRALAWAPERTAAAFDTALQAARKAADWPRARMLLQRGGAIRSLAGVERQIRAVDDAELKDLAKKIVPGGSLTLEFPELGPTMSAERFMMQMEVRLPKKYASGRRWPLFVMLHGGTGGPWASGMAGEQDFVSIGLSYPLDLEQPSAISPNPNLLWALWKKMLAKLEQVVPNIDPDRQAIFGFSNGGMSIMALLLGEPAAEFSAMFRFMIVHEGGATLDSLTDPQWEALKKHHFLFSGGTQSAAKFVTSVHESMQKRGVDSELFIFEGGHEIPPAVGAKVQDWLRRKVLGPSSAKR